MAKEKNTFVELDQNGELSAHIELPGSDETIKKGFVALPDIPMGQEFSMPVDWGATALHFQLSDVEALEEPTPIIETAVTVTRIVGDGLVYASSEDNFALVFTPDKIAGYSGERLRDFGIFAGAKLRATVSGRSVLSVHSPSDLS